MSDTPRTDAAKERQRKLHSDAISDPVGDECATLERALSLAQDALSECLTHAEMPDTLVEQVKDAYRVVTDALPVQRGERE